MNSARSVFSKSVLAGVIALGLAAGAAAQKQILPPGDGGGPPSEPPLSAKAILGQNIFFDAALSSPRGLACAGCHDPGHGWADPRSAHDPLNLPTSEGAAPGRFVCRNAESLGYACLGPDRFFDPTCNCFIGGLSRDGGARDLSERIRDAFLSRTGMNNPNIHAVVQEVRKSTYAPMFENVYGHESWSDPERAFAGIADSLVEFLKSPVMHPFTSRYDRYLAGELGILTSQEKAGLALFEGKGGCTACHPSRMNPDGSKPLFTTFRYENIGVPRNPRLPCYDLAPSINPDGVNWLDKGLGGAIDVASEVGKFKIPSLRNVALTPPYTHNGFFTTLNAVVQFHNTRDIDAGWGAPEIPQNLSIGAGLVRPGVGFERPTLPPDPGEPPGVPTRFGNLGLGVQEVDQIVAFLKTLNEGPTPAP